ncbi:MAG: response regulator transcription factor [Myxococcota bacterium]
MRILIVEDEAEMAEAIARRCTAQGDVCEIAGTLAEAEAWTHEAELDVVVLDRGLPDGDALQSLATWRAGGFGVPVLVLTARSEVHDRVEGLAHGADDYLGKPFAMAELLARIAALGRRGATRPMLELQVDDLQVDLARREVRRDGVLLPLRVKEYAVLELLVRRQGRVVSRAELRQHCWGDLDAKSNVEEATVASLRRKLGRPPLIHTRRGLGYIVESSRG